MRKSETFLIIIVSSLLILSVLAQEEEELVEEVFLVEERAGITPDSPMYVVDRVVERVNLAVRKGDSRVKYAMKVNQEKVAEAATMVAKGNSQGTHIALANAGSASAIIQKEVSPELEEMTDEITKENIEILDSLKEILPEGWENIETIINKQMTQEERNRMAAKMAKGISELCMQLAMVDFELMEKEPRCDPENAPEWLKDLIEDEIKQREKEAQEMLISKMTQCIKDPRECDCSDIPVVKKRLECERNSELAVRCEFELDMKACDQLDKKEPEFSDMPPFLRGIAEKTFGRLIKQKEKEMFKKLAPPECIEAGLSTREECEALMMEKYAPPECKGLTKEECMELMLPEECKEGGAYTREECEAIMEEKHGQPPEECEGLTREECMDLMLPEECKEAGATTQQECEAVMLERYGPPPDECTGLTREECLDKMLPDECKEADAYSREECEAIMEEKYGRRPEECEGLTDEECMMLMLPEECKEAGVSTPEECMEIMLPEECKEAGAYTEEECSEIMTEVHSEGYEEHEIVEEDIEEEFPEEEITEDVIEPEPSEEVAES
jgi:hypothetical protein